MKVGLVLEGGAMRGMYTSGVLDAFLKKNIDFPYVIGVSAGAAYGTSYVSKQIGRNLEVCEKYINDKRYVSFLNLVKEGSLFGLKFVYEDIPKIHVPFDFKMYYSNPAEFYSVVTNIETGLPEYIGKDESDVNFDILKATCALPLVSPVIEINGRKYLDGGISDPIPYKKAFEDGCDKVVVILTQDKTYIKQKQKFLSLINLKYKNYKNLCKLMEERHNLYNNSVREIEELEKEGKAIILRPDKPVGFKRIETDVSKLTTLYYKGEYDGFSYENKIKEFIKEM